MTAPDAPRSHGFPDDVLARLGPRPLDLGGVVGARTLKGEGLVAKTGPSHAIARERYVLSELAARLPIDVPRLVDAGETWILTEAVADIGGAWSREQTTGALADLAALHAVFADDVAAADSRLRDPLGPELGTSLRYARRMAALDSILPGAAAVAVDPTPITEALASQPATLLHGDPWPSNIVRPGPTRRVWVDWSCAARGPAALDLATWLDQAPWILDGPDDPTPAEQYASYVAAGDVGDLDAFLRAVDAATVLWFLTVDLPRLPIVRHAPEVVERLLAPRRAALTRLLRS